MKSRKKPASTPAGANQNRRRRAQKLTGRDREAREWVLAQINSPEYRRAWAPDRSPARRQARLTVARYVKDFRYFGDQRIGQMIQNALAGRVPEVPRHRQELDDPAMREHVLRDAALGHYLFNALDEDLAAALVDYDRNAVRVPPASKRVGRATSHRRRARS